MTTLNLATAIRLGSAQASRVYLGATQVWPAAVMPPAEIPPVIWDVTRKGVAMTVDGLQMSQTNQGTVAATMSVDAASANRYAELRIDAYSGTDVSFGIIRSDAAATAYDDWAGAEAGMVGCWENGSIDDFSGASSTETTGYARFNAGDTVALLLKRGKLYFGIVSGSSVTWWNSGNPAAETGYVASGLTGRWALCASMYAQGTYSCTLNVGDSTFAATPPAGAVGWKWAPTLGAHTMLKSPDGLTPNPPSTAPISTFNPTNIFVSRGGSALITVQPTDSKGNTYEFLGSEQDYNGYAGEWGAFNHWMQDGVGDSALTLTLDNSAAINREVTMEVAEVIGMPGASIPAPVVAFAYPSAAAVLQGPTIHVQGPALLIAVWSGDGGVYDMTAVPDAAWTVIDSYLNLPEQSGVQYAIAVRDVTDAGDYSIQWTQNPAQGALLWIFGFPSAPPVPKVELDIGALPPTLIVGTAFSQTVAASNSGGATGAITISAASLPPGLSISATAGSGPYTATISGTPTTEADAADFTISASNGAQSASATWNVKVNAASSTSAPVVTGHSGISNAARQSSLTFTIPSGASSGDYALICVNRDGTTSPTTPSGWTLLNTGTASADGQRASIYGKALVAADITAGSVSVALNGTNWATGTISTWSGVDAANVASTVATSSASNSKPVTMTATGVASVTANSVLIGQFCRDATSPTSGTYPAAPSGWTLLDGTNDSIGWSNMSSSYTTQASAGDASSAGAVDSDTSGGWIAFMVALPPTT